MNSDLKLKQLNKKCDARKNEQVGMQQLFKICVIKFSGVTVSLTCYVLY